MAASSSQVWKGGGGGVPGGRLRESEKEDLKAGHPETGQAWVVDQVEKGDLEPGLRGPTIK